MKQWTSEPDRVVRECRDSYRALDEVLFYQAGDSVRILYAYPHLDPEDLDSARNVVSIIDAHSLGGDEEKWLCRSWRVLMDDTPLSECILTVEVLMQEEAPLAEATIGRESRNITTANASAGYQVYSSVKYEMDRILHKELRSRRLRERVV